MADEQIDIILAERGSTHGLFADNALLFDTLTRAMQTPQWNKLNVKQRLALQMIALKIARILSNGAPVDFVDPWLDGAGYFTLGARACN